MKDIVQYDVQTADLSSSPESYVRLDLGQNSTLVSFRESLNRLNPKTGVYEVIAGFFSVNPATDQVLQESEPTTNTLITLDQN